MEEKNDGEDEKMNMFILCSRDQFCKQNAEGAGIDHGTALMSHVQIADAHKCAMAIQKSPA